MPPLDLSQLLTIVARHKTALSRSSKGLHYWPRARGVVEAVRTVTTLSHANSIFYFARISASIITPDSTHTSATNLIMSDISSNALQACFESVNNSSSMAGFDYLDQPFVLQTPDGGFATLSTTTLHAQQLQLVNMAAVFASQLGASLAITVVLLLMTTPAKCKNLPFIFNVLALLCDVIRCALQLAQLNSGLSNFIIIALYLFDDPGVQQGINQGVAGVLFTFFLFIFIELALITQVRVVCAAATSLQRSLITAFTIVVGLLAVAFRCYLSALNIHSIIHVGDVTEDSQSAITQAQNMSNISAIVSICVFSGIFCFKLALAIRSRRSMGLKQFGPMQIIFIMGCQTLVVPAIFAILAYYVITGAQIQSCVETIVAIFLPLSSIWASANTNAMLQNNNHNAVIALPEYKGKKADSSTSDLPEDERRNTKDGLSKEDRTFRSKYDDTHSSTHSIDKYINAFQDMRRSKEDLTTASVGHAI